ncbi:MAG TPA: hypothetical protein VK211_18295 [Kamptonema sp.]|nr:hypothetical protein [Kamptonema sp.]
MNRRSRAIASLDARCDTDFDEELFVELAEVVRPLIKWAIASVRLVRLRYLSLCKG